MSAFYIRTGSGWMQYYFTLIANNREVILKSEMYTSKSGAQTGIQSVKANAPNDERYERKRSSDLKYYFVLRAANGEKIGVSEMYNSQAAMENGIQAVKTTAPYAQVIDKT